MRPKTQDKLTVIILAGLCLVLYVNSFWNTFVFDDIHSILKNLYIKDLRYTPLLFKGDYTSVPDIPKGMLRPLLLLTFAFNYLFSGLNPLGFHIINTLLHFLNGVLFYSLLKTLKTNIAFGYGLFFSLLFVSHPINSEAVTYISCRSDLLVTFFILSAFLLYVKRRFLRSIFLYIFALFTKETALVFCFLAFSYEFICAQNILTAQKIKRCLPIFYGLLILITLSYWLYRMEVFSLGTKDILLHSSGNAPRGFWPNIFLQSVISLFYLRLFFWPHPLTLHHIFPEYGSLLNPAVMLSFIAIIIMVVLIFILRKGRPLMSLGLSWYIICLLPKFYGALSYPAMEHHFYMSSIGVYFILAELLEKFYLKFRCCSIYTACGIIGIFTILVWFRNYEWKDAFIFYKFEVKNNPSSGFAHANLGLEYLNNGLFDAAEKEFKKAMSLSQSIDININSLINLANVYCKQNKYEGAKHALDQALAIKPDFAEIYQTYGYIYKLENKLAKAEEIWKKGLYFNPRSSGILDNLGLLYIAEGKLKEAKEYLLLSLRYAPDNYFINLTMGQLFEEESNIVEAIKYYRKSVELNFSEPMSHYMLGSLYAKQLNPKALYCLKEAIRLNPRFVEAHNNLAVLYASMEPQRLDLAREHARKALSLGYPVEKEFLKLIGIEEKGGKR